MLPPSSSSLNPKRARSRNTPSSSSGNNSLENEKNDPKKRKGLTLLSWNQQEWNLWKNCNPRVGSVIQGTRFISSKVPLLQLYEFSYGEESHAFTPDLLMESQRIGKYILIFLKI